jgi:plasmid maintenance system antidote protein VapI
MTAGEALQAVLDALGTPQSAFAYEAGISAKHLNQLIKGHANFTPETSLMIADALAMRLVAIDTKDRMETLRRRERRHG